MFVVLGVQVVDVCGFGIQLVVVLYCCCGAITILVSVHVCF